jgi:ubiquitin-conjugating enzyme E2 Q
MTSITPRHQEDETTSSTTAAPPPIAEEVFIEEDDDARSPSFAIICNGDSQVQDLQSVEEQEESDYEYDYEDDDDGHFTGFLASTEMEFQDIAVSNSTNGANIIEDCQQPPPIDNACASVDISEFPRQEEKGEKQKTIRKSTWKEPSQAAVTMSLRAERETCGGKRRLASDLYKIMVGDTTEQGFTLEPTNEDSMDTWKIKLFGFDPDSNLQKDMDLLGLDHIELEMTFPDDVSDKEIITL